MQHSSTPEVQSEPQPLSIDSDHLAILLWDYFGSRKPRTIPQIASHLPVADANDIALYRHCAESIIAMLERGR